MSSEEFPKSSPYQPLFLAGVPRVASLSFHPAPDGLEIAAFRDVDQEGMIRASAAQTQYLHSSAGLPGGSADGVQEGFFADQAGAGAGEEDAARGDGLQGEAI